MSSVAATIWPKIIAPLSTPEAISPLDACRRSEAESTARCTSASVIPNGPEATSAPSSRAPPVTVSNSTPSSETNGGTTSEPRPKTTSSAVTKTMAVARPRDRPRLTSAAAGGTSSVAMSSAMNAGRATRRTCHNA